jgi:hypothetical protein
MAAALVSLSARSVSAQTTEPATHLAASYSYLKEQGIGGAAATMYPQGWVATVDFRIGGRIAAVGEAGGSYRSNAGVETQSLYGFFGGIRVDVWRVGPAHIFAQALVGLEDFREPGFSEHGLAVQPGGGVDLNLTRRLAIRVEGDFRAAREEGVTFKESRVSAGVVMGLGR